MKKSVSGFDVARLVSELQELSGAFFDKAYQLGPAELAVRFNKPGSGRIELYVNFKGYLYLSRDSGPKPEQPSAFAMLLRKHLGNARVQEIYQHEFDRIIVIRLGKQQNYKLVFELFGEGNAVLVAETEEDDRIINTLYQRSWSARTLRPKHPYEFPPAMAVPFRLSQDELTTILHNAKRDLVRALAGDLNLGGLYAEEVCIRTGIDKNTKAADLEAGQIEAIHKTVMELHRLLTEQAEPVLVYDEDTPVDVVPFGLKLYENNRTVPVPDLSSGLQTYFAEGGVVEKSQVNEAARRFEAERAKLERQLDQQKEAIDRFSKKSVEQKRLGDLIYQHYQLCETVLAKLNELRDKYDWDEILDEEMFDFDEVAELNHNEGYLMLKLINNEGAEAGVDVVRLDFRLNVNKNAEKYYESGKSAREKLDGATSALADTERQIAHVHGSIEKALEEGDALEETKVKREKRKAFWFEKYKWFITSEGFLVVAGSDATSNEKVVKRYLRDGDRYVHADLHGAPSAVVRKKENSDEAIPEATLEEACSFALAHSKAWSSGLGAATAYWVNADQVSKTPAAGEFVGKGAFIVRGKRNYGRKAEIMIAIGEIEWEGAQVLMCAPVPSIKSRTGKYLVLKPGKTKKTTMAKKLSKTFGYSLDEVMHMLPPGDLDIIENMGIELE